MPNNPHDALFRRTFSAVEHAAAELRVVLPPELRDQVDLATLRLAPGTFVDSELAGTQSDLLFSVEIDHRPGLLYLLFEHQSTVDALMPFRILKYVVRILDQHIGASTSSSQALPLPVVIPIVVHHSDTGWNAATELERLFDESLASQPGVQVFVPRLAFLLDDISRITDDELAERALGLVPTLTLWALRDARTPERLLHSLLYWASAMRAMVAAESGRDALLTIFRYLTLVVPDLAPEVLHRALSSTAPEVEQIVMTTLAERWQAEGEARGRAEGEARGRGEGEARGRAQGEVDGMRSVLLQQLELKFGLVPEADRRRLEVASLEQLRCWSPRVLVADALSMVFSA